MAETREYELEKPYTIELAWHANRPIKPENEWVDIRVRDVKGDIYTGAVTTPGFISDIMEKNRATGEFANGSYFCAPGLIVVRSIDEGCLRNTIDDLLDRKEFLDYFRQE